jgi:hypothetical protein
MANSDSKGKPYFVGLMLADGWVYPMDNQETQIGIIQKGPSGQKILSTLAEYFGWDTKPYKKVVDGKIYWRVQIYSNKKAKSWATLNVVPNKTHEVEAPEKFKNSRHFWRGIIDGDGTIGYQKGCPRVRLSMGSEKMVRQFRSYCSYLPTRAKVRKIGEDDWRIGFHGNYVETLLSELYKNSPPFALQRKYKQAKNYG